MNKRPLTRFVVVGLVLLFISGCWMVGSLTIVSWRLKPEFLRTTLLTTNALANISFLVSILASILGLAEIVEEERARKTTAYAFAAGVVLLIVSIALFSWVVATGLPWIYYD